MEHPASSGPYREASEPAPDEEVIALARLVARAQRVRTLVAAPILVVGVTLGIVAYTFLRLGAFEGIDSRAPYFMWLLVVLPITVLAQALAAYCGQEGGGEAIAGVIAEMTKPGTSPALLEAFVRSL